MSRIESVAPALGDESTISLVPASFTLAEGLGLAITGASGMHEGRPSQRLDS